MLDKAKALWDSLYMLTNTETKMTTIERRNMDKVVGIVDGRGYLFCSDCAEKREKTGRDICGNGLELKGEPCDGCGAMLGGGR